MEDDTGSGRSVRTKCRRRQRRKQGGIRRRKMLRSSNVQNLADDGFFLCSGDSSESDQDSIADHDSITGDLSQEDQNLHEGVALDIHVVHGAAESPYASAGNDRDDTLSLSSRDGEIEVSCTVSSMGDRSELVGEAASEHQTHLLEDIHRDSSQMLPVDQPVHGTTHIDDLQQMQANEEMDSDSERGSCIQPIYSDPDFCSDSETEPEEAGGERQAHGSDNEEDDYDDAILDEEIGSDLNFDFNHPSLNKVLRFGKVRHAREAMVLILVHSVRHKLTYEALIDNMKWFNMLLNKNYLPTNKKALWRVLNRSSHGITNYAYCDRIIDDKLCGYFLGKVSDLQDVTICACGHRISKKEVKYFIILSFKQQLQRLLALPGIADLMRYQEKRNQPPTGTYEDIFDGSAYQALNGSDVEVDPTVFDFKYNFTFNFNSDGFQLWKSSTVSAWPLLVIINNLPPQVRQKHVLMVGLWVGNKEPNMVSFLRPFVDEANELSETGISWQPDGVNNIVRKFLPACLTTDSKARCIMLNMTQHNGYNGCTYCTHRGFYCARSMRYPNLPHPQVPHPPEQRTDASIRQCMNEAAESGESVTGVQSPSELMNLTYFDLAVAPAPDRMHAADLGVVKLHTNLMLKEGVNRECYIGSTDKLATIDRKLSAIKTPSVISRKPRSIYKIGKWTASEYRNWIFYYFVPCLQYLNIPEKYIHHVGMLSTSLYLLSKPRVSEEDIVEAERLLNEYVRLFERYFGVQNMRYNVHLLPHLCESVRQWGPLWTHETYWSESFNRQLLAYVSSPKCVETQITTRYLLHRLVAILPLTDNISDDVKKLAIDMLATRHRKKATEIEDHLHVSEKGNDREPNQMEAQALHRNGVRWSRMTQHSYVIFQGVEYRPSKNGVGGLSDDSVIVTKDFHFCKIESIIVLHRGDESQCGLFVKVQPSQIPLLYAKQIVQLSGLPSLVYLPISEVDGPAIEMHPPGKTYAVALCNRWEIS